MIVAKVLSLSPLGIERATAKAAISFSRRTYFSRGRERREKVRLYLELPPKDNSNKMKNNYCSKQQKK